LDAIVSDRTDAPARLAPSGAGLFCPEKLSIGRDLFDGRTTGGDVVTFVCFDDGYAIRGGGMELPGCRWATDAVDEALAAFRALARPAAVRLAAPPAA
jgi:hypothetical protein